MGERDGVGVGELDHVRCELKGRAQEREVVQMIE